MIQKKYETLTNKLPFLPILQKICSPSCAANPPGSILLTYIP